MLLMFWYILVSFSNLITQICYNFQTDQTRGRIKINMGVHVRVSHVPKIMNFHENSLIDGVVINFLILSGFSCNETPEEITHCAEDLRSIFSFGFWHIDASNLFRAN